MKFFKYFWYVIVHKWFVFIKCIQLRIPLIGIVHDWHKFLPSEFFPYMNFFHGTKKKKVKKSKDGYLKPVDTGDEKFEIAWLKHIHRSKHHWQTYIMPQEDGTFKVYEMPVKYRKEMVADWYGAGKAQKSKGTLNWYSKNKDKLHLGPKTRAYIEKLIGYEDN